MSRTGLRAWIARDVFLAGLALFVLSLAANLMAVVLVTGPQHLEHDSDEGEYYARALLLLEDGTFEGVLRTPGWPLLLALVFAVSGPSVLAGKLINVVAGAGVAVGVFALASAWLPRRWAWLAGAGSALLPSILYVNASLYSETVPMLGFIWGNVFVLRALARAGSDPGVLRYRPFDWLALGVLNALINLVKPAYVPWLAMLALAGAWYWRRAFLRYAVVVATVGLGFCLVMAPWWARNVQVTGHFVPFSTAGDLSLLESNNPTIAHMKPSLSEVDGRVIWTGSGKFMMDKIASGLVSEDDLVGLDEVEKARLYRARALEWMAENPATWASLAVKKVGYAFGLWPLWPGSYRTLLVGLPFTLLAFVSLPGWWWVFSRVGTHRLLLLHPLAFIAITLLFFGSWRYRAAYEPSFVIAALLGLHALVARATTNRAPDPRSST